MPLIPTLGASSGSREPGNILGALGAGWVEILAGVAIVAEIPILHHSAYRARKTDRSREICDGSFEPIADTASRRWPLSQTGVTMKKIGMIGGLSWISTAEYYKRINEITQAVAGGVTSARIVLESVNRQEYVEAVIDRKDERAACAQIESSARALQAAGADFIVITCNDVHRFVPTLQADLDIPFLHIAQVTAEAIKAKGLKKVAILGVRKTMESNFYSEILAHHGIEALIPNEDEKRFIHDSIYQELVQNRFLDETRSEYKRIITTLGERGADCVALACTEIPLLLPPEESPFPAFSTTELHCQAAVDMALAAA